MLARAKVKRRARRALPSLKESSRRRYHTPDNEPGRPAGGIAVVLVYSTTHVHFRNEIGHFNYGIMFWVLFSQCTTYLLTSRFFLPLHYYLFG